jgi:pyridinium-3,5-biscarboxylic acid mononucleotide sulfurtransferase
MHASTDRLVEHLGQMGPLVVAFSGGVDSTYLAAAAGRALGDDVLCVTARSPSMPEAEAAEASALASSLGLHHLVVDTHELDDPRYAANGPDRCAWCKTHLMDALGPVAQAHGGTVVLGVNVDDLGDHRPGQEAAAQHGARFPLVEVGLTKAEVREASRALGLTTADKPASPCLASRIPYGTPVTVGTLGRVERAERAIKQLGFVDVRVRHHGDVALVEVPEVDLGRALDKRASIVLACRDAGYTFCSLDLEGLSSGRLNRSLG